MSTKYPAPSPEYAGPAKFQGPATNKPIKRITIHGTVSPTVRGGARNIANYFRHTVTRPSSAHYVVDPGEVLQVVFDSIVAYHAPPNEGSVGVELCDWVASNNGQGPPAPASRWSEPLHREMLQRAARLVAELCLAYDVPIRKVGQVGLRLGRKGICGHHDVSKAWGQTSHWDPGKFPWKRFIRMVKAEADEIRNEQEPTSNAPTRITRFRSEAEQLIAKYLDPAVTGGRDGVVKDVRDEFRALLARLPRR